MAEEKPDPLPGPSAATEQNQQEIRSEDRYRRMGMPLWVVLIACIISAPFLFTFDLTISGTVQPNIVATLGEYEKLPWIATSYALGATAVSPLWGKLFVLFNVKWVFLVSVVTFLAGSALSGAAPTMNALIVGRVMSGCGVTGLYAGAMNALTIVTTIQQRPIYVSYVTFAVSLGNLLGPVLAGVLADSPATWRWAFYLNLCIGGVFTPGYLLLFPSVTHTPAEVTLRERLTRVDALGNVLWAGVLTTLLMAISFGGALYAWGSGQIIALWVCTGVLVALFLLQQIFSVGVKPVHRIFPFQNLPNSRELGILIAESAASNAIANTPIFLLPLYFQLARGSNALGAALPLLPFVLLRGSFVMIQGTTMRRLGYAFVYYIVGAAFCVAGTAPFLVNTVNTPSSRIYGLAALIGAGSGLYNQVGFTLAAIRVGAAHAPQAVGILVTAQIGGGALVIAIANCIFINKATIGILKELPLGASHTEVQGALLGNGVGGLSAGLSQAQRSAIKGVIVHALDNAWGPIVAAAGLSLVLACFLKRDRLFQPAKS